MVHKIKFLLNFLEKNLFVLLRFFALFKDELILLDSSDV